LRETLASNFLFASMSELLRQPDTYAYKQYRDRLLEDCGSPADPIGSSVVKCEAEGFMGDWPGCLPGL
jgi:hypothetical protein